MGLDNGVFIRFKDNLTAEEQRCCDILSGHYPSAYQEDGKQEILYWRKCWNIRNDIFANLSIDESSDPEHGRYPITIDDLSLIVEILKSYNKKRWESGGSGQSIWEWYEMRPIIKKQIEDLKYFLKWYKSNSSLISEIVFYDSY